MLRKMFVIITLALAAALIAGCAQIGPQPTPVPATKTPKPTFTPTPDWTPTPMVLPTATDVPATPTPEATATPEPTPEPPTPTPAPVARLSASQTVNVRSGPGTNYAVIGRLNAGQSFEITGKNAAGDWWQFDLAGRQGWVVANLVSISGDPNIIQVAQNIPAPPPPPTARPTARPQPTAPPAPTAAPQPQYDFQLLKGVENCESYGGTTYFNGYVRHRSNALRNGVCIHIAYFEPRVTKCSGCDGVGDGAWGFSPFGADVPPAGTNVEIYVVSCPPNVPPGGVTSGFGDLTPRSEKFRVSFDGATQKKCEGITFVGDN